MAEDIEPRGRGNSRRLGSRVVGIDDPQQWLEVAMGDSSFRLSFEQIENGNARGFTAGPGRGGYGDQRLERSGDGNASPDRRVDVFQKVRRVGGIQIRRL